MKYLKFFPIVISFLVLAAHFTRYGFYPIGFVCIILPFLLLIKKIWSARLLQIFLLLGAFEWVRTVYFFVEVRIEMGQPWIRLAIILLIVTLFTILSALIFQTKLFKEYFN